MGLAKVTFIKSVKVRRCELCCCVAACYIKSMVVCVLCAVCCALHSTQQSPVAGFCNFSNGLTASIKDRIFLDKVIDCRLLKKDSAP